MRTRNALRHPSPAPPKRRHPPPSWDPSPALKRRCPAPPPAADSFDNLPDDLVLSILSRLAASASSPSDLVSITVTCKRMNDLALHPLVLSKASPASLAVRVKNWSDSAHRFLKRCADAGNLDSCFITGMIRFYCLQLRGSGASLMARAAIGSHAAALYSLAVIQFNGSGGTKGDRDLRAGVALCARAAYVGHIDAIRELGHCLQDGYGIRQNVAEGRRFLLQASARELAAALAEGCESSLLVSDHCGRSAAAAAHPANRFLSEWFVERGAGEGMRLCSHAGCGRPETRRHEFRRCSVCGTVNYCSRACQALDWKRSHKADCVAMEQWILDGGGGGGDAVAVAAAAAEDGGGGRG